MEQLKPVVHIIPSGSDAEHARHGDLLVEDERYDRFEESVKILRGA